MKTKNYLFFALFMLFSTMSEHIRAQKLADKFDFQVEIGANFQTGVAEKVLGKYIKISPKYQIAKRLKIELGYQLSKASNLPSYKIIDNSYYDSESGSYARLIQLKPYQMQSREKHQFASEIYSFNVAYNIYTSKKKSKISVTPKVGYAHVNATLNKFNISNVKIGNNNLISGELRYDLYKVSYGGFLLLGLEFGKEIGKNGKLFLQLSNYSDKSDRYEALFESTTLGLGYEINIGKFIK